MCLALRSVLVNELLIIPPLGNLKVLIAGAGERKTGTTSSLGYTYRKAHYGLFLVYMAL